MATLATTYLNARNEISGADTTNMPDSRLLAPANSAYLLLVAADTPRITQYNGGTFGWATDGNAGTRSVLSVGTNFARINHIRYEGTDATTTTGEPLRVFKERDEYEAEKAAFPGTNGRPRACFLYRDSQTLKWWALLHPATDAVVYYLSFEGEVEPQALTSGASTLLTSPANIARLDMLLAHWIGVRLGAPQEVLDSLLGRVGDAKLVAQWLGREESKGEPVKGEERGRP